MPHKVIGLIAGLGELPVMMAAEAVSQGYSVVTVALSGLGSEELARHSAAIESINPGKLDAIFKFLKRHGVTEAVMGGKVPKIKLFDGGINFDMRTMMAYIKLKDRNDDTLINAVAAEFKKEGITLRDMREFCPALMTPTGTLTRRKPTGDEAADLAYGFEMAKAIGRLDIGQTIVVKGCAVIAVEAIEGTDEAIRRGGQLASGPGAVVVKVSRPKQDMRFDVPVMGLATLAVMREAQVRAVGLEADKSIIVNREEFIAEADRAGIAVVGMTEPPI